MAIFSDRLGARGRAIVMLAVCGLIAAPATAQSARPSDAELKAAIINLNLMVQTMRDKQAPAALRDAMFGCLYEHQLGDISARVTKTLAASKANGNDPEVRLKAIGIVCGLPIARQKSPAKGG